MADGKLLQTGDDVMTTRLQERSGSVCSRVIAMRCNAMPSEARLMVVSAVVRHR